MPSGLNELIPFKVQIVFVVVSTMVEMGFWHAA